MRGHIFLYGPTGSGKTTVGSLLAECLALPFLDLDAHIETICGESISTIIAERGQEGFRELEARALRAALDGRAQVVALGGGSLLREENRALAETSGRVVFLEVSPRVLAQRLQADSHRRPLLAGDLAASLDSLLKERQSHYDSFPLRVNAEAEAQSVAEVIQRQLGYYHLCAMGAPYDALVCGNGLNFAGELLKERGCEGPILLVSDEQVAPLYAGCILESFRQAGYPAQVVVIPAGEQHKTVEMLTRLWQACLEAGLERGSTLAALGGGVVSDLTGFAAATYMRGCSWVAFPTTLLAMVDASLGGKTGFDLPQGKNLVGAFYPPRLVLSDPSVLASLPERELRAGLAEVLKHGVIGDPDLFAPCARGWQAVAADLPQVVWRAQAVKVKLIEADPYEKGLRAALNFGHTIGHAVELVSGYSLRHGEAVAIGMVVETRLAEKLGIAADGLAEQIRAALAGLGLPVEIPAGLPRADILRAVQADKKKSQGTVKFALPEKVGLVRTGVEIADLDALMEE